MFAVFQFMLEAAHNAPPAPALQVDFLRKALAKLRCDELLVAPYAGGCDVYLYGESRLPARQAVRQAVEELLRLPLREAVDGSVAEGNAAVSAFLSRASGLRMEAASPENLEQFRHYFQLASRAGVTGPVLQHLFQRSLWLHEKIRLETEYFRFALDEAGVLRELMGKIFGQLKAAALLSLGISPRLMEMLNELYRGGVRQIAVRAEPAELAVLQEKLNFPVRHTNKTTSLETADIILVSETASDQLTPEAISRRMSRRKNALLAIFSESRELYQTIAAKRIYNVFNYTIDDLERRIAHNRAEQGTALRAISSWLEQEGEAFRAWVGSDSRYHFAGMIGSTPEMQRVFELISRIAQTDITVLIQAESGTGKELVARGIHALSSRAENPFVVVNCGAIPENLLESELFGHEKGAFTGAIASKVGLFREADNGTIFLDEIGELPLHLQVKLLRFLQDGEIKAVGSNTTVKLNVRVLAATNQNLEEMVENGRFRSDLYYRLNVIQITLPPLRDRRADIPILANYFLRKFARKFHKDVQGFSEEAMVRLRTYGWPGNVRELENAVEHSVALSVGELVTVFDLPRSLQGGSEENGRPRSLQHLSLKEVEKKHILDTLAACQGNYEEASQILGIGRTTLWRKLREYNMQPPS